MRRVSVGLGALLLVDALRVFLPSVVTVFGMAAETPAELLGAFALAWFVLPLAAVRVAGRLGWWPALALAAGRVAVQVAGGGRPQLWLAALTVLAGLVWLAGVAVRGDRAAYEGLVLGLALSAVLHGALGTVDLAWRSWPVVPVVLVLAAALAVTARRPGGVAAGVGGRVWWVAQPAVLLWGALGGSPSLVAAAVSYLAGSDGVATSTGLAGGWVVRALVALAVAAFVGAALGRPLPWVAGVALVAGTALGTAGPVGSLPAAVLLVAGGLGGCLAAAAAGPASTPARRGYGLVLGGIGMAVAAVLHYSAYDLGFDNRAVFPLVALAVAAVAVTARPAGDRVDRPVWVAGLVGVVALVVVPGGRWGTPPTLDPGGDVRVVAYNVRMGFGLDGRFEPGKVARQIAAERPDVVVLSEVDRGWWLNGGHDGVAVLAERLGMPYWFAPAADAVWGDALLTRLPVVSVRTRELTAAGAPTGAQALGAVLRVPGGELAVVSTHLQPPPHEDPVTQAREVGALAAELGRTRPVVVAGDLNTEPGDPAFRALLDAGLTDGLRAARPLPTSPADDPANQIDHVLVSPGVRTTEVTVVRSTLSDHLMVSALLTYSHMGIR